MISIELVKLFPWEWPKVGRGTAKWHLKKGISFDKSKLIKKTFHYSPRYIREEWSKLSSDIPSNTPYWSISIGLSLFCSNFQAAAIGLSNLNVHAESIPLTIPSCTEKWNPAGVIGVWSQKEADDISFMSPCKYSKA